MNIDTSIRQFLTGQSAKAYEVFGAHADHQYDKDGISFRVYAPYASNIELVGDFNNWQGWQMDRRPDGVWTIFCDNIPWGALYKYRTTTPNGEKIDRADPFAFYSELRPSSASRVWDIDHYHWNDGDWLHYRRQDFKNYTRPMSIYEVHAGSWRRIQDGKEQAPTKEEQEFGRMLTYRELADQLIPYVKEHHFSHIELMPLTEYPFDGSWGYQATGYYSATSRYGDPYGLMEFIDRCHQANIGVILDVVPLHFVTDFFGLHQFDGGFVYESANPDERYTQWGTVLFDYTKPHTLSFMKSSLDFWINYYHIDGLRYDAVSQLIYKNGEPGQFNDNAPGRWFLCNTNFYLQQNYPQVMLMAEDSSNYRKVTAPPQYGGLGFDYKWDLGWMNDTLEYFGLHPHDRYHERNKLMFSMAYFYDDLFILPLSHDEVVHGKRTIVDKLWGDYDQKFSQLRLLYLYMCAHPGKVLNFMGNELAEFREWDENKELGWNLMTYPVHDAFNQYCRKLHTIGGGYRALYDTEYDSRAFRWLDTPGNPPTVFAFARRSADGRQTMVCVMNCGLHPETVRVPAGSWRELINSDDSQYSGSGVVNEGEITGSVKLAPLSGTILVMEQ